jgi:hypothetical protein
MTHFDAFNGDADGLCSLVQLRLDRPRESVLVTGVKRDNALLARVAAQPGDSVTVLDLSLAVNHDAVMSLLERGVDVEYFDHHFAGDMPTHPRFTPHIDCVPDVCTGVLVDRELGGRFRRWAIAAAFGDNLDATARRLAATLAIGDDDLRLLRALGQALAYNAYGEREADLLVPPADVYRMLVRYVDPLDFVRDDPLLGRLTAARETDLARARGIAPSHRLAGGDVYVLPDAMWGRRVRGAFGDELALASPRRAHAVLTPTGGGYVVSVRAPLCAPTGADALCRQFAEGGGRAAAAGINRLPPEDLDRFLRAFDQAFVAGARAL